MKPPAYRSTLALMCLAQLLCWAVLYYAFASMVLPMQRELGWTAPQTMGAFTLALAAWGGASYAAGTWIDRERSRTVMAGGALLAAAALLLWSAAQALWQLYLALLLVGVAMAGTLYDAAFSSMTRRYPSRYRQAVTVMTLVGGLASTLAFPALAWLVPALGWRHTLVALAGLMLGVALLYAWALRPQAREAARSPGPVGAAGTPPQGMPFAQAVRGRAFWMLTLCFTANAFIIAAFWAHAMAAFAARGWSEGAAVAVLAWIGPAQVGGRAVLMLIGTRLTSRQIGNVVLAGLPLAMLLFAVGDSRVALLAFAALYGFSAGMATIVRGSAVPETFGTLEVARIAGLLAAVSLGGRAAAPLLAAWGVQALGGYRELALALAALGGVGFLAYRGAGR